MSGRTIVALLLALRLLTAVGLIVPLLTAASIPAWLLACAVTILIAGSIARWVFLLLLDEPSFIAPPTGLRVAVVTSYVPNAEPLPMLERTLAAMQKIDYAHDSWLLDEGDDEATIQLCQRLGIRHFSRKNRPEYQTEHGRFQRHTKHGNYNAWLVETGFAAYDVLAAIDPDHIPVPSFLTETLGQLSDPRIGYVQSPQEFYNQGASLVARGGDEEGRDFYWIVQRAYHRFRAPSVIGAHGVHRMEALKKVGGLAPHIADDLLITLRYQLSGWCGAYVPKVLARGLAPVDWPTYLKQQRRWARSSFDVKFRLYPRMARELPLRSRVAGFLQGLTYLQDSAAALCGGVALGWLLIAGIPATLATVAANPLVWSSAAILVITGPFPHRYHGPHRNVRFYWRAAFVRFAKWPYTLLALFDVIRRRDRGYELTSKMGGHRRDWRLFWPHLVLLALIAAAWSLGVAQGGGENALLHVMTLAAMFPSLALLFSRLFEDPAAFDALIADRVNDA